MKYLSKDGGYENDDTIKKLPEGATKLTDAEWDSRRSDAYVKTSEDLQIESNEDARQYLASTDWLLIRELDGGAAMTAEIKQLRVDARLSVIK